MNVIAVMRNATSIREYKSRCRPYDSVANLVPSLSSAHWPEWWSRWMGSASPRHSGAGASSEYHLNH
jgi:hypothetical protein